LATIATTCGWSWRTSRRPATTATTCGWSWIGFQDLEGQPTIATTCGWSWIGFRDLEGQPTIATICGWSWTGFQGLEDQLHPRAGGNQEDLWKDRSSSASTAVLFVVRAAAACGASLAAMRLRGRRLASQRPPTTFLFVVGTATALLASTRPRRPPSTAVFFVGVAAASGRHEAGCSDS
jgi:hypothetical protein